MSRLRLKRRELVLLGLPTLAIVSAAAFLSRRQAVEQQNQSGPYRAEITRIERVPVSPFEAWQGFDTKIVVHARDLGQLAAPVGARMSPMCSLDQHVFLSGSINGKLQKLPVSSQTLRGSLSEFGTPGALRVQLEHGGTQAEEPEKRLTILAATSKFDANSKVELRGDIWFKRTAEAHPSVAAPPGWTLDKRRSYSWLETRSKTAPLTQSLERVASVNVDRTAPPVQEVRADLLSPVFAHVNPLGDNGNGFVRVFFKPGSFSNRLPSLRYTEIKVLDASGREVEMKDAYGRREYPGADWDINFVGQHPALVRLPLESVPLERGALTMKMWLAFGDGWPAFIQCEVRPAWMSKRPKTLQLQSVGVKQGTVVVRARYSGTSSLEWENPTATKPNEAAGFFDSRDYESETFPPRQAGSARLYTFWSQHFTLPNGKSYWYRNAVDVESVSCDDANNCQIIYKTNALGALKPGQSAQFFAQIGIEGDGFLPIQATISRPKK